MRRIPCRLALVTTCVATLTAAGAGIALAAPDRVPLAGTGYQSGYGLTDDGPSDPTLTVTDDLYLSVRDPAALAAQARSTSTPDSPGYEKYRTPAQIQAQNQLTPAQLRQVREWLTSAGLTVTEPNWRTLRFTGTIAQLDSAFDVTFDSYTDPDTDDPYHWQLPTTDLSVPADVARLVLGVATNSFPMPISSRSTAYAASRSAKPNTGIGINRPAKLGGVTYPDTATDAADSTDCSRYWGQRVATGLPAVNGQTPSLVPCGYTPNQIRRAYGFDRATVTGKGQTVAVVTPAMDTLEQDVNTWSARMGVPRLRRGQLTVVPTADGSPALSPTDGGFIGMVENTLDVESVHGMAPDANIISVGPSTANDGTILDSLIYILDHTHATIASLSLSFTTVPGMWRAYDQVYEEGAEQGVGFYYASGDGGHDPTTGTYLNPAAASDWTTGVGGTSLGIGADGSRQWETGWGDGESALSTDGTSWETPRNGGGAGGGWQTGQPRPWYQQGVVSDQEATGPDGQIDRTGPDVAMDADAVTGLLVGGTPLDGLVSPSADPSTWQYAERRVGGTSLSTPLFAGVQALAQQARGGVPFGFANPELYRLAGTGAFRDVTRLTGTAPSGVTQIEVAANTWAPYLFQVLGQIPATPASPLTPWVGPGFDTETGIGVPTVNYLRSVGRR